MLMGDYIDNRRIYRKDSVIAPKPVIAGFSQN